MELYVRALYLPMKCFLAGNILLLIERYGLWIQNSKKSAKSLNLFQFIPRVFGGTLGHTDSEPESPTQSESLEMQRMKDAQVAVWPKSPAQSKSLEMQRTKDAQVAVWPKSPTQSESLEMQRWKDAQVAVGADGKSKLQRINSEDYKANTP